MNKPIIIAENLKVIHDGREVLDNISFKLYPGETLIITGASGSGKTLLAMVLAKKFYAQGTLDINYDATNNVLAPKTEFVEQRYSLKNRSNLSSGFYFQQRFNSMDVEDCYTVLEELQTLSSDQSTIDKLLDELQLTERENAPVIQLSSGEHKRFQLIKAFLQPAQLMILDEPFIGLDASSRQRLYAIIQEKAKAGAAFVIISGSHHDFPESTKQVLELAPNGQHRLIAKKDFRPIQRQSDFAIDMRHIVWKKSEHRFENAVKMVHVFVKYDDKIILNDINWTVRCGERWLVKGHNGAGKSTLLSLITGDNPQAYANEIYLFDKRRGQGESIWDIKKPIGFVSPEIFAYYDRNLSVHDTVAGGLFDTMGLYRKLHPEQEEQVNSWIKVFGLEKKSGLRLRQLSSGQQRLVLLANALVKSPDLVLLDEPCQGLDEVQTQDFVKMIDTLSSQIDTTILYISHYENEIPHCMDHVLELDHGKAKEFRMMNGELRKNNAKRSGNKEVSTAEVIH